MGLIITLIIVGILLIIAELVLIPGIFVTGTLGVASLVASCYFAFDEFGQTGGIITIAINIVLIIFFVIMALRAKTWRKLSLSTNIDSKADLKPEEKGVQVGQEGATITRLAPMGKARINGVIVEVTSQDSIINPGVPVVVSLIDDNRIFVKIK